MSLLIDVVKGFQGESIEKVETSEEAQERLDICNHCPFMQGGMFKTCGTFLKGGKVTYDGKEQELCGCIVEDKVKYKLSECPLGKW